MTHTCERIKLVNDAILIVAHKSQAQYFLHIFLFEEWLMFKILRDMLYVGQTPNCSNMIFK